MAEGASARICQWIWSGQMRLDIKICQMKAKSEATARNQAAKSKAPETVSSASQDMDVTMDHGYIADTKLLEYAGKI